MDLFVQGMENIFHWDILLIIFLSVFIGITIGALPGLTATMGIALLSPFTFSMSPVAGIMMLIGVFFGGVYGGSITAILINTPGTPAAAATAMDGYAMTQKGLAHKAITVSTLSSTIGGMLSVLLLIFVAPLLAKFALLFSSPEVFGLTIFGISIISSISGKSLIKGLISGVFGLLISTVGMDPIGGFPRFTLGITQLNSGFEMIVVMIGLFAAAQVFETMGDVFSKDQVIGSIEKVRLKWNEFRGLIMTILYSTGIGAFIGIIPGAGAEISCWVAYNETRRLSKNKKYFGKGEIKGVVAPEASAAGSTGGSLIPLLSLGIPGDSGTAVMIGALMVHGLTPGPELFTHHANIVYTLFVGMFIAYLVLQLLGMMGLRVFTKILKIPKAILTPFILIFCIVGSYAIGNNLFDVWVMLVAGIVGYFMQRYDYPVAPVILALILGPLMEENFRQALVISGGDFSVFLTRPITVAFLVLAVITLFGPIIMSWFTRRKAKQ